MNVWVRMVEVHHDGNKVVAAFNVDLDHGQVSQDLMLPAIADTKKLQQYRLEFVPELKFGGVVTYGSA